MGVISPDFRWGAGARARVAKAHGEPGRCCHAVAARMGGASQRAVRGRVHPEFPWLRPAKVQFEAASIPSSHGCDLRRCSWQLHASRVSVVARATMGSLVVPSTAQFETAAICACCLMLHVGLVPARSSNALVNFAAAVS